MEKLLIALTQTKRGGFVTITADCLSGNSWLPLSGAAIYFRSSRALTDDNGSVTIGPEEGFSEFYIQKNGYEKSGCVALRGVDSSGEEISFVESPVSFVIISSQETIDKKCILD